MSNMGILHQPKVSILLYTSESHISFTMETIVTPPTIKDPVWTLNFKTAII